MRWLLFSAFLAAMMPIDGFAQFSEDYRGGNVDSLENVLLTSPPEGSELLKLYQDLSWRCLYTDDYERLAKYSEIGIELALDMDSLYIAADLCNNLGVAYDYVSDVEKAMECFNRSLELSDRMAREQREDAARVMKVRAITYGSIANLLSIQGQTSEALTNYFKALELFENIRNNNEIANILGNIAVTYLDIDNVEQAEIYMLRKEEICRRCNYQVNLAHALAGLSSIYLFKKEYLKSAKKYFAV